MLEGRLYLSELGSRGCGRGPLPRLLCRLNCLQKQSLGVRIPPASRTRRSACVPARASSDADAQPGVGWGAGVPPRGS